ncbi:uncharacterized protein KZ484_009757 isoform 1-T1 [Pholidichthys leucotaenia]
MKPDALDSSDFSLTLRKPTLADSGNYTCSISDGRQEWNLTAVEMEVKERPKHKTMDFLMLVFLLLYTLIIAVGLFCLFRFDFMRDRFATFSEVTVAVLVLLVLMVLLIFSYGILLICSFPAAHQVNVAEGSDSTLLPCTATLHLSEDTKVEWTDSRNSKVHINQNGSDQAEEQNIYYRNRTKMNKDLLETGDVSLILEHPTDSDSDTYICTIYSGEGDILMSKHVRLSVTESTAAVTGLVLGLPALGLLLALTFSSVSDINDRYKRIKTRKVLQMEKVKVKKGVNSVLLPFKTNVHLLKDAMVRWTCLTRQNQNYKGHTEMKLDQLRTGDVSLILKEPKLTDNGVYSCAIYKKDDGLILEQKVVMLQVKARVTLPTTQANVATASVCETQTVEVTGGVNSVLLPFETNVPLSVDVTVEWTCPDSILMKIHVHQNGQNQPYIENQVCQPHTEMNGDPLSTGDLSLTLREPRLMHDGVYTCTVYKDGHILKRKAVILRVKVFEEQTVEVTEGVDSVLLPYHTFTDLPENVTVEWRQSAFKNMKIHEYPRLEVQENQSRTEMDEHPLSTGDFSLTLQEPKLTDTGVYACTIYNNDGEMLRQKVVVLIVKENWKTMMAEVFSGKKKLHVNPSSSSENRASEDFPLLHVNQLDDYVVEIDAGEVDG